MVLKPREPLTGLQPQPRNISTHVCGMTLIKVILFKGWLLSARGVIKPEMTAGLGNAEHTTLEVQQRCFIIITQLDQIHVLDASLMAPRQVSGSINFLRNNPPSSILTLLVIINLWHSLCKGTFTVQPLCQPPSTPAVFCDFSLQLNSFQQTQGV